MKNVIVISASLVILLGVGWAVDDSAPTNSATESQLAKAPEPQLFVQGAMLVRQIDDPEVVAAAREEYLTNDVFADHLPITVESIQIEAFQGRQYMTVIAKDKDGMCVSSVRDYVQDPSFDMAAAVLAGDHCFNRNCTGCSAVMDDGEFVSCSDCPSVNNPEDPGWCDHYFRD